MIGFPLLLSIYYSLSHISVGRRDYSFAGLSNFRAILSDQVFQHALRNTILITVGSLKFFDLVYAMTGGGPVHRTEVLASHIYTRSFQYFEYGYGNALSIILLLICLLCTVVINMAFVTEELEY